MKSDFVGIGEADLISSEAAGLVWNQRAPRVVWNPDEVAHGIVRSAYRIKFLRLGFSFSHREIKISHKLSKNS